MNPEPIDAILFYGGLLIVSAIMSIVVLFGTILACIDIFKKWG